MNEGHSMKPQLLQPQSHSGFDGYKLDLAIRGRFMSSSEFEWIKDPKKNKTQIGVGSFGEVRLALHKSTNVKFAIKIMNLSSMRNMQEIQGIEREVRVHSILNHPNIITFHDSFQEGELVYIVLDYASNGNLYSHMFKKKILSEQEAYKYFQQTCAAIQYLHSLNVVHRDLKPENILLDEELNVKVCDFGWCTEVEDIENPRSTFCGTYEYMAPEIVFRRPYDYRVDVWALGVLIYELLHGCAPFKGRNFAEIQKRIERGDVRFSENVSDSAKKLISKLLQAKPEKRFQISEILQSTWMIEQLKIQESNSQSSLISLTLEPQPPAKGLSRQQQQPAGSGGGGVFALSSQIVRALTTNINCYSAAPAKLDVFPTATSFSELSGLKTNVTPNMTSASITKAAAATASVSAPQPQGGDSFQRSLYTSLLQRSEAGVKKIKRLSNTTSTCELTPRGQEKKAFQQQNKVESHQKSVSSLSKREEEEKEDEESLVVFSASMVNSRPLVMSNAQEEDDYPSNGNCFSLFACISKPSSTIDFHPRVSNNTSSACTSFNNSCFNSRQKMNQQASMNENYQQQLHGASRQPVFGTQSNRSSSQTSARNSQTAPGPLIDKPHALNQATPQNTKFNTVPTKQITLQHVEESRKQLSGSKITFERGSRGQEKINNQSLKENHDSAMMVRGDEEYLQRYKVPSQQVRGSTASLEINFENRSSRSGASYHNSRTSEVSRSRTQIFQEIDNRSSKKAIDSIDQNVQFVSKALPIETPLNLDISGYSSVNYHNTYAGIRIGTESATATSHVAAISKIVNNNKQENVSCNNVSSSNRSSPRVKQRIFEQKPQAIFSRGNVQIQGKDKMSCNSQVNYDGSRRSTTTRFTQFTE